MAFAPPVNGVSLSASLQQFGLRRRGTSWHSSSSAVGRLAAEDLLEGELDERRGRGLASLADGSLSLLARSRDWSSDDVAVGQRERLLRHDALAAAVAFVDAGGVEQLEELGLLFVGVAEIDAAARRCRRPACKSMSGPPRVRSRVAGRVEQGVADGFGFQPPRVHPPQEVVVAIDARCSPRLAPAASDCMR